MLIRRRGLLGSVTRGKTLPNRLRPTDTFLLLAYPERIRNLRGLYVDLGFGHTPVTSVETHRRLRRLNPGLRLVGVDIDPARVAAAQPLARPGLEFRLGGFDLPLGPDERASIVRAVNVLRQYPEEDVPGALAALGGHLAPGGLLLEGTSDPTGRLLAFVLHERAPVGRDRGGAMPPGAAVLRRTAVVLAQRLRAGASPRQLQAVLPPTFIHHAAPGSAVDRFFEAWEGAWLRARPAPPRQRFARAARWLAGPGGYGLDLRPALWRRGFLVLAPEWPARRESSSFENRSQV